jgi:5-methylcytosine-specific restriction protein A
MTTVCRIATPPAPSRWSPQEFAAAVRAYLLMLEDDLASHPYVKRHVNDQLRKGALHARSRTSVEQRMQNITHVLQTLGAPWIGGYKPLANVGPTGTALIIESFEQAPRPNPVTDFLPTPDPAKAVARASAAQPTLTSPIPPLGNPNPPSRAGAPATSYERLPGVIAWTLRNAGGVCELCKANAPFLRSAGEPYLEVHHVVPLAKSGRDAVDNAVALCPNCHRRCHHSTDANACATKLYATVGRLVP